LAFSGGVFSLVAGNPVTTATTISSTWANNTLSDIATNGLSMCLLKDGSQVVTGNIPMSSFKFTGLAAGNTAGDSIRYEQLFTVGTVTLLGNLSVTGTTLMTGVATLTAQPILSALTASRGVATDASKGLVSLPVPLTNSLSGDVALNNTANYFDGPAVAQGTTGTWFVSGAVTVTDTNVGGGNINVKLWDGTTVVASGFVNTGATGGIQANQSITIHLSGFITTPAGNLRISARNITNTANTSITFNLSGNSKDSTITAVRVF